jgi:hypothetical protein
MKEDPNPFLRQAKSANDAKPEFMPENDMNRVRFHHTEQRYLMYVYE